MPVLVKNKKIPAGFSKISVKIPKKCRNHNHNAQLSQGTKGGEMRKKKDKTNVTYETTDVHLKKNCNRKKNLERSIGKPLGRV